MIEMKDVEVRYGNFIALPKFNLEVRKGEFFTLLGPSGCGKSTALRTLAGFIQHTAGNILVSDQDVTHLPSHKRGIGMVFQNYALFPTMTVRENIAFGLTTNKTPREEINERVDAIAQDVNLTSAQLEKNVSELSGGQQQRVAIARALILKPKILLLDEPLSNLDAKLRHQLRIQLKELQIQFGITTVYVTHDQEEALILSDRIAVMNVGKVEQVGTPREIYKHSATQFVCGFIGDANEIPANIIDQFSNTGIPLQKRHAAFVRLENTQVLRIGAPTGNVITIPGKVSRIAFHGLYGSIKIDIPGGKINAIYHEKGDLENLQIGENVLIAIDPKDVLQYQAD